MLKLVDKQVELDYHFSVLLVKRRSTNRQMGGECALLELPSWHSQLCSKPTDIYQLYDRKIESNKERKNYIKIDFGID